VSAPSFAQMFCLACAILLVTSDAGTVRSVKSSLPKGVKAAHGKYVHWGPQNFLGWFRSRRSDIDNRVDTFPRQQEYDVSPEASAVGESIMDEFLMYLTLK
ncbi:hypothetical protein BaRGS_00026896, partial [Batillaria attramentaria]